jgi:regulation of enolase protein 1 (concanavalin A-like superfamily)
MAGEGPAVKVGASDQHKFASGDEPLFRAQLARILSSSDFSSSRHLSEFLAYSAECALQGRTHLDQVEMAAKVLGRPDFNPIEDATVRKIATHVRQRLEHYYAGAGEQDDVRVVLPVRSYIPRFERIERPVAADAPASPRGIWRWAFPLSLVLLSALGWWWFRPGAEAVPGRIELLSLRGDIVGKVNDAAPGSIQLGPRLREEDQITVRLSFTAEREAQQAGILVWADADNFVRLGRKFTGRNLLEFDLEKNGVLQATPSSHVFEPEGQDGMPLWLSIRRSGPHFLAFASRDGRNWSSVGPPLQFEAQNLRAGVYAWNGRRDAPAAKAAFDQFSVGPTFSQWDSRESLARHGFNFSSNCADGLDSWTIRQQALIIAPQLGSARCSAVLSREVTGAEWVFKTRLDFLPTAEVGAGIFIRGSGLRYRLVRNELNGAAISWINEGVNVSGEKDFSGSPAIYLRLTARQGELTAGFSRDDREYKEFPPVAIQSIGSPLQIGLGTFLNDVAPAQPYAPPQFTFFRQESLRLEPVK